MTVRGNRRLRRLDRALGVPALAILGLLPKRSRPVRVDRFGLLRTAAIGDTLLLRGVLEDARAQLPDAEIELVTGTDNAEAGALVASGLGRHVAIDVRSPLSSIRDVRARRFDILVDSGSWPRMDALLAATSGARFRVGFRTAGQSRHFAYDAAVLHDPDKHETDNFRALFRAAGIESATPPSLMHVPLPAPALDPAPPYIVFHPWAGGFRGDLREWPTVRWLELGRRIKGQGLIAITGTAANADESAALAFQLRDAGVFARSFAGSISLANLATLLKGSAAVVSVNTGVMHLAALVGARTVGLDGPTSTNRWGAVGPRVASVRSALPDCGFLDLGFEYDGHRTDCMLGIAVDAVEKAILSLMAASNHS